MTNREIYDRAFSVLKTQNAICDKLESIGLRFEYGDGFVGETLLSLLNDCEAIVIEALGLHEVACERTCKFLGSDWPTNDSSFYTEDNDPTWSITADDFCEFFYRAQKDETVRELMWKAMVKKDAVAKENYNKLGHGRIGEVC